LYFNGEKTLLSSKLREKLPSKQQYCKLIFLYVFRSNLEVSGLNFVALVATCWTSLKREGFRCDFNRGYRYRHSALPHSWNECIPLCRAATCMMSWRHVFLLATPCGQEEGVVATLLNCYFMCWQTYRHKGAALLSTRHEFRPSVPAAKCERYGLTTWQVLRIMSSSLQMAAQISKTVKGKAFPLQAWAGPWGSRTLRLQNL
jgi:hypothetical protein